MDIPQKDYFLVQKDSLQLSKEAEGALLYLHNHGDQASYVSKTDESLFAKIKNEVNVPIVVYSTIDVMLVG